MAIGLWRQVLQLACGERAVESAKSAKNAMGTRDSDWAEYILIAWIWKMFEE